MAAKKTKAKKSKATAKRAAKKTAKKAVKKAPKKAAKKTAKKAAKKASTKAAAKKSAKKKSAKKSATRSAEKASSKKAAQKPARRTASELALKQRDISISEFFAKNRHLLGFDNPSKALLTTVKEGVDNALDACEEAGALPEIVVEIKQLSESRFRIAIQDNGPGIEPGLIAQVTEAFYTTRSQGTGLGLAVAQVVAKAHHGRFFIEKDHVFEYG